MLSVDRSAFRFFLEHAGYCSPPGRVACARDLARSEALLKRACDLGVASVEWVDDQEPYDPGDVATEEEAARYFDSGRWTGPYGCIVQIGEGVTGRDSFGTFTTADHEVSLWGIVVGPRGVDEPYCRVVAAELALEVADDLRQAIGDALDACQGVAS